MNGNYLIPANSKKSMLLFGVFNKTDLIIFVAGIGITLLLWLLILDVSNLIQAILSIFPAGIACLLVMPVPNYHNARTILKEVWDFYMSRQKYVWKGWCFLDGQKGEK